MLIRKNTKAYKSIVHIVKACQHRDDRQKLVRIYITRAGQTLNERISVDAIQGDAALFYDMGYETLLSNLESASHQLQLSDTIPGIYYFHSSTSKLWDEAPFEFDEKIKKEFESLQDLPEVRKKDKTEKYILPAPKTAPASGKKVATETPPAKKTVPKSTPPPPTQKPAKKETRQPAFKLRQKIHFSNLDTVIFTQPKLTKEGVLNYYDQVSDFILPYLKDRPLAVRIPADDLRNVHSLTTDLVTHNSPEEKPDWLKTSSIVVDNQKQSLVLCADREHLLFCVQQGCVEFNPWASRAKSTDTPDYILLGIDSPKFDIGHAARVACTAKEILDGLSLPSFIQTDGKSGLYIYIPADSKSEYNTCLQTAEYICKLIRLKTPDKVALEGSDDLTYGKVSITYTLNAKGNAVPAPYSLVGGDKGCVATPLRWDEVTESLDIQEYNHQTIAARLKKTGDPFENLFRKKINAEAVLDRLQQHYSFLF